MKILTVGDIVAPPGRTFIHDHLNRIREELEIDFCIANGENACTTNGIRKAHYDMLIERGVDMLTMGNHTFAQKEVIPLLEYEKNIMRPANYPPGTVGDGYKIMDLGLCRIGVINALGRVYMDPMDCPFRAVDKILNEIKDKADVIVIDFHAETTSEKLAFANYFDGRASVVFGTHTHVQTSDARILPGGTAYVTDIGMTGVVDSILGVKKELIIEGYLTRRRVRYEKAEGEVTLNGAVFDIDHTTGKAREIRLIRARLDADGKIQY